MDFAAEGLLDGLGGDERVSRERLLERLLGEGFSLADLKRAVAEDRLALLPVDRVLQGKSTAQEIEEQTGLPAETMLRVRRLLGLPSAEPEERVFSSEDLEAARSIKRFLDAGFGEEPIAEITAVLGEGMGRLAATIASAFAETFLSPGDSEEAVAERFASLAGELTPQFTPILVAGFTAQLRDSVGRAMLGRAELASGELAGSQETAVCFADIVGFTRLGGQIELDELGNVAGRLGRIAAGVTEPPVRLVKTIGDAAMFVSPEPGPLIEVALSLVEAVEAEDLPSLRAGIAFGPAVLRAGDYFGTSVNLASRVTGVARAGSVLCTQEVHDLAGEAGIQWSFAGRHRLKGIAAAVALHRARRESNGAAGASRENPAEVEPSEESPAEAKRPRGDRSRKAASS